MKKYLILVCCICMAACISSTASANIYYYSGTMDAGFTVEENTEISMPSGVIKFIYNYPLPQNYDYGINSQSADSPQILFTPQPDTTKIKTDDFGNQYAELVWDDPSSGTIQGTVTYSVTTTADWDQFVTSDLFPVNSNLIPQDVAPFLAATEQVQSDNSMLISLAGDLTYGLDQQWQAVSAICGWVMDNIFYGQNPKIDAVSTYTDKMGACSNYSHLACAVLRAAGIPARFVGGRALSKPYSLPYQSGSLTSIDWNPGPHAWIEIYYPSLGWVPYEPQRDLHHIDTRRISHGAGKDNSSLIFGSSQWYYTGVPPDPYPSISSAPPTITWTTDNIDLAYVKESDEINSMVFSTPVTFISSETTTTTTTTTTTITPTTTTTTVPPTTTTTIPSDPYSDQPYSSLQIYLAEGSPEKEYYDVDEIINLYVNYKNSDGTNINLDDMAAFGVEVDWITNNPIIATVSDGQVEFKDNGKVKIIASSGGMTSNYDFMVGEAGGTTKDYGNLIILAGGDQNDSKDKIKNAIQYLANRMYSIFKARGFTDEDIYYINHIDTQDLDGDGVADGIVDQTEKTVETFQNAIKWAEAQANDGPLYLYVVNHGEKNATFLIDSGQILYGAQFDAFLDNFEDNTNRVSVVMLEACYSGSFIDQMADTDRVIFSSSAADKYSFLSDAGDVSFSQFLSTYLLSGYDWEESFDLAANDLTVIGKPYAGMNPQKAIGSQVVPGKVFGDFSMASFLPKVETYTTGETVDTNIEQTFSVELDMLDTGGVTVWATVTPPNYQPPSVTGEYTTPALGLDTFTLASAEGSKTFTGSYTFPCNGTYQVTYYVKDSSGNVISIAPQAFVAAGGGECPFNTAISPAWNLISLPVIPDDPSVAAIFADMKENVASAWKWDAGNWAVYLPGNEDEGAAYAASKGFGQLTEIGCGEGFWVNAGTNQNLSVSGIQPSYASSSLTEGWNLIGLKSDAAKSIADFVSGNETKIASVWKWDTGKWAVYLPGQEDGGDAYAESKGFSLLSDIAPGEGFWVNCMEAVTLD